jgi:hypothetical protein
MSELDKPIRHRTLCLSGDDCVDLGGSDYEEIVKGMYFRQITL